MLYSPAVRRPPSYFANDRADLVARLPSPLGRTLDVGCGSGEVGVGLRARGATPLVGVEIDREAAERGRAVYDELHVGGAEEVLAKLEGPFSTIVLYDVLEHLVDPWAVLRRCHAIAAPGATLHVSVPNVRHLSTVYDVLLRGTFGYTEWGHRDVTHLRWFTPRDIERAVEAAGWDVVSRSHTAISHARRLLGRLTGGRSTELLVWQWQVLARRSERPRPAPAEPWLRD